MATLLVWTVSAYTPFTKILSANINQDKTDVQNRLNWSGTAGDTTTGLSGDNIQSYTAITPVNATGTVGGVAYTAVAGQGANGNSITIAYTAGGTAGSEVVTVVGTAISVSIASGTSTITQVATAITNSTLASALVTTSSSSATVVTATTATALTGGVTGGGLVRSTKLGLGTANQVVINNSTGQLSSEAQLAVTRGGTGISVTPASQNSGDVLQVNATKTGFTVGAPTSTPASLRIFQFYRFI